MRNNKNKEVIVIGYTNLLISLPIFVAYQNGLFEKYGLNIKLKKYTSADTMIKNLSSGQIDICGYCALPITFDSMSEKKDERFLFIGGVFENNKNHISLLLINKDSDIKSFHDLSNKKIGVFPTKAYRLWIKKVLNKYKVKYDEKNLLDLENNEKIEAQVEKENFDAIFVNSSIVSEWILKKYDVQNFETDALIPKISDFSNFYFGSFNIREKYALQSPEIVRKISLALDKSIEIISQGKNKYLVEKAINEYLPGKKDIANKFLPAFCKTNEVEKDNLVALKNYYYHQDIFPNGIDIEKLQFQYYPFITKVAHRWEIFVDFFKKNAAIITTLLTIIWLTSTSYFSNRQIRISIEQSNKQLEILQKSTPAEFSLNVSTIEPTVLSNVGISSLTGIEYDWRFYFINKNEKLFLATTLSEVVKLDTTLLRNFVKSGLIKYPDDFDGLFGINRDNLPISYLEPPKTSEDLLRDSENNSKAYLDNSLNAIINAIRCSKILNSEVIMKWNIRYKEELSKKEMVNNIYLWFDSSKKNNSELENLELVLGGKRLIEIIDNYEDNTKDIIYNQKE